MNLSAVLYLIGAIVAFVSFFVIPPRFNYNLLGLAVGFIGAGLFCQAAGVGA
jgi:hypothetical protein